MVKKTPTRFYEVVAELSGCTSPDVPGVLHVAGHVYRGGCEVLPGRVGSGSAPSPQSGHHLQGP